MNALLSQMDSYQTSRKRLEELATLIEQATQRGHYSIVAYLNINSWDQTILLADIMRGRGYTIILSIFKHKAIICWTPEEITKSYIWKFKRFTQYFHLL